MVDGGRSGASPLEEGNPKRSRIFVLCEYCAVLLEFALLASLFLSPGLLPTRADVFYKLHLGRCFCVCCLALFSVAFVCALVALMLGTKVPGRVLAGVLLGAFFALGGAFYSQQWRLLTIPYIACRDCVGKEFGDIGKALEQYFADHKHYPEDLVPYLTTPVPYLAKVPSPDPFLRASPYLYVTDDSAWILASTGPDETRDMSLDDLRDHLKDEDYLVGHTYDPSNGTITPGDVILDSYQYGLITK
jgi:hypothetical protein